VAPGRTGPAIAPSDFEIARAIALTITCLPHSLATKERVARSLVQTGARDLPTLAIRFEIARAIALTIDIPMLAISGEIDEASAT
jgi:hypothetical protein